MGKKENPHTNDHYAIKAKKEGYPARSVYKLMEIQQKFKIIDKSSGVLDIGAAPGSWSLYILKELKGGFLVSVDIIMMDIGYKGDNFAFLQGDAFAEEMLTKIKEKGPYKTVLSDAAPSTTGNRTVDTERSLQLVESVIDLAEKTLSQGGNLVVKIFQGGGEKQITERMKKMFKSVKIFKPDAVKKISFETYLIGTGMTYPGDRGHLCREDRSSH
ncbi:MAG: RlmE family RNA methyltransferase [Spirochaetaceae bacterium]|nr:RlmE family RNA methyltransferase [Spirochaetaceae bacterium]